MKDINLEIKRMLGLLESKMGDVRPIIQEQDTEGTPKATNIELKGPEEWLNWIRKNCLPTLSAEAISPEIQYVTGESLYPEFKKSGINNVLPKEPYLIFVAPNKAGDKKRFYVFGTKGNGPEGSFKLIIDNGEDIQPEKRFKENHLNCKAKTRTGESYLSKEGNLTADQKNKLQIWLKNYTMTGWELTTVRPTGNEANNYSVVDLATGKDKKGNQVLDTEGLDGLDSEFKEPGVAYVWAKTSTRGKKLNTIDDVQSLITDAGYTFDEKSGVEPITVSELLCTILERCNDPITKRYVEMSGDQLVYEDPAKTSNLTAQGGLKTRKVAKNLQKEEANKKKCRSAIVALHTCMRTNNDETCKKMVNQSYSEMGVSTPPTYPKSRLDLGKQILTCESWGTDVGGMFGGKNYEKMWEELKTSSSKFSPYSQKNKEAASTEGLEESIGKNIRLTLVETLKKRRGVR